MTDKNRRTKKLIQNVCFHVKSMFKNHMLHITHTPLNCGP